MNTKKFLIAVFFSVFAFFGIAHTQHVYASTTNNVYGEAYSDDVGWFSFNNCASPTDTSAACTTGVQYGVTMDNTTGNLSGAAWSNELGWISFNANSTTGCTSQPKVNLSTGAFSGFAWAQTAIQTSNNGAGDGWSGCIALSAADMGQSGWGMFASTSTGAVTGQAWGDNLNVGWLVPQADMKIFSPALGGNPPIVTLNVTPTSGTVGQVNPSLTWSATNSPNTCEASGDWANNGSKATSNSTGESQGILTIVKTYTYSMKCTNAVGTGPVVSVTVTVNQIPAPVVTISASPTSGTVGVVNPTITWSVTNNPTSCTASGDWSGGKAASGSSSQGVLGTARTYTYTLNCSNAGGSGSGTATVSVSAPSSYTVTACNPTGGTITPSGTTTVSPGASAGPYTIKANSGYSYHSLSINGANHATVPSYTFSSVTQNSTICATFISNAGSGSHIITATSDGPGTISPYGDTSVPYDGTQNYSIVPNTGKYLETLLIDGKQASLSLLPFTHVTSNHTIYALFGDINPVGPTQCSDGIDNDQNGLIDFKGGFINGVAVKMDPSCTSFQDNSEGTPRIIYIEQ